MNLSAPAAKLLQVLVDQVHRGRFDPDRPETFMGYGEALELADPSGKAVRRGTDGQTLQAYGMEELALKLQAQSPPLPAITGLIVSKSDRDITGERRTPNVPGRKFFTVFKRKDEDWPWWLDQARQAIAFDWSPYVGAIATVSATRTMNSLERALVTKAGYANGWENVGENTSEKVVMFSARHKAEAHVTPAPNLATAWEVTFPKGPPTPELLHSLPELHQPAQTFQATSEATLGRLLRRAAELAMSLPNQAAENYAAEVAKIDASPPTTTEALRLVKQRVGQDLFRQALMDYWCGACAVTGIDVPELLRASHAKPWAKCDSDTERLNVFNGFLLCAHLDALFDRGLMTFDSHGKAVFSPSLGAEILSSLGLSQPLSLRWMHPEHGTFLEWHRRAWSFLV